MSVRPSVRRFVAPAALAIAAACGDGTGPAPDPAQRQSQRFSALADSLTRAGQPDGARAMRAIAELIRLSGRVTTVSVAIDGEARSFNALAVQLRVAAETCEGDPGCVTVAPEFSQVLFAWRGESLDEAVVIAADTVGALTFGVPGPIFVEGPGDGTSGDPFDGPLPVLHTLGAYGESASERLWATTGGTLSNGAAVEGATCPAADPEVVPADVAYDCARSDFTFAVDATLHELPVREGSIPSTQPRTLVIAAQPVAGLAITLNGPAGALAARQLLRLVAVGGGWTGGR